MSDQSDDARTAGAEVTEAFRALDIRAWGVAATLPKEDGAKLIESVERAHTATLDYLTAVNRLLGVS